MTRFPARGTPWRKIVDVEDAVTRLDARGETIYLLTHRDASRFKIVTLDLSSTQPKMTPLVPPSDVVITGLGVGKDALYVQDLDGGLGRLRRVPFDGGKVENVALPFEGSISSLVTDPRLDGVILQMTSWTKSPLWYAWDSETRQATDTKLAPLSPVDFSGIDSAEVKAELRRNHGAALDHLQERDRARWSHPTLLDGYGAYGITIDLASHRHALRLARARRCSRRRPSAAGRVRRGWHLGGKLATKQHTIDDFVACAQYLIENKYTSSKSLAGEGTSAGGITIGGAITQRPDLFGAALIRVGDSDALRSEDDGIRSRQHPGVRHREDRGGFRALFAMDAYHHVKPSSLSGGSFDDGRERSARRAPGRQPR